MDNQTNLRLPWWFLLSWGAMIAFQIVQFFLIFLLYHYISNIEHRMENEVEETKQNVIRLFER